MVRFVRRFKATFITLVAVGAAVFILALIIKPFQQTEALVTAISVASVNSDCTEAVIRFTDDGSSAAGIPRSGLVSFSGSVAIPDIAVQCPAGPPDGGQCNGQGPEDDFTVSLNGGAGYASASPVTINYAATQAPIPGTNPIFFTAAGFSLTGTIDLPACTPPTPPTPDPGTTTTEPGSTEPAAPPPPPPLDPPGTAPRLYGDWGSNPSSKLVVYDYPTGPMFYYVPAGEGTGSPVGLADLSGTDIPGQQCLIASVSNGNALVGLYYLHSNHVQANLYVDGVLVQEAGFDIAGIGARAGNQTCTPQAPWVNSGGSLEVVSAQPDGSGGSVASAPAGTVQVACRQNLRQQASVDTAVLAVMDSGASVQLIGRSNDGSWLEVMTTNGVRGWAFNGRCMNTSGQAVQQAPVQVVFDSQPTVNTGEAVTQQTDSQTTAPQPVAAPAADGPMVGIVCRQNMRSGPGTNYAVQHVLEPGTNLTVVGRSSDGTWLQVSAAGGVGGWTYFGQCVLPQAGDVTAAPVTVAFGG